MAQINPGDCSAQWAHPIENDGWFLAHNALRADMAALGSMLEGFDCHLEAGKAITRAQAAAAQRFVDCWIRFIHHHHRNEDDIGTPYLSTRFQLPDKLTADHKRLQDLLDSFDAGMRSLLGSASLDQQQTLLQQAQGVFGELHPLCLEHFAEEEQVAMPAMRAHFTPKEIEKHVVSKITRGMDGDGLGAFFRPMSREQRRAFAKQEGIPFFIRWILFHRAAKYERVVWAPFERECLKPAGPGA